MGRLSVFRNVSGLFFRIKNSYEAVLSVKEFVGCCLHILNCNLIKFFFKIQESLNAIS